MGKGLMESRKYTAKANEGVPAPEGQKKSSILTLRNVLIVMGVLGLLSVIAFVVVVYSAIDTGKELVKVENEAVAARDMKVCDRLDAFMLRLTCCSYMGSQLTDVSVCESALNESCRDICLSTTAEYRNDASICERVSTADGKADCVEWVRTRKADDQYLNPAEKVLTNASY